jgi:hypothetical protein
MKKSTPWKSLLLAAFFVAFVFGGNVGSRQDSTDYPQLSSTDFEDGRAEGWQPNIPAHWRIVRQDGSMVYELFAPGEADKIRRPTSWSLLKSHDVTSFVFSGRLKCNADPANPQRDLCLFFHFQDPTHFYYVHLSASSDEVHNIIGLVNGADRVKINREPPGQSVFRLTERGWHTFKVSCDSATGEIKAYLDDMRIPILTACDKTIPHGLVGIGSFDDVGCFDDIGLWGEKTAGVPSSSSSLQETMFRKTKRIKD